MSSKIAFGNEVLYHSNVTFVILLGFPYLKNIKVLSFLILFVIYCVTVAGNCLVIILIVIDRNLHSPMYIFVAQLSLFDIMLATDIVPNLLNIVLNDGCTMSLSGCIIQLSFFSSAGILECLLLTVMSFDRYVAICKPLHYNSIISRRFCVNVLLCIWLFGFQFLLVGSMIMHNFYFCGPNVIDHFFCDVEPTLNPSCSSTSVFLVLTPVLAFFFTFSPFSIVVLSYICIVLTILRIPSVTGRQKAFTTCSSHLTVVSMFYGTLIIVYLLPTTGHLYIVSKVLSVFYTSVTPLLNPIIYTFRNKDFKRAFKKITSRTRTLL